MRRVSIKVTPKEANRIKRRRAEAKTFNAGVTAAVKAIHAWEKAEADPMAKAVASALVQRMRTLLKDEG